MLRMIEKPLGLFAAMIRNAFIILLAAVLLIFLGLSRILDMNRELKEMRAQVSSLSAENMEKDAVIAGQEEDISARDLEIARLSNAVEEAGSALSVIIRMDIRLAGCIKLGNACFNQPVSREIFDSVVEGEEVSNAPWLEAYASEGLVSIRFFAVSKMEG